MGELDFISTVYQTFVVFRNTYQWLLANSNKKISWLLVYVKMVKYLAGFLHIFCVWKPQINQDKQTDRVS